MTCLFCLERCYRLVTLRPKDLVSQKLSISLYVTVVTVVTPPEESYRLTHNSVTGIWFNLNSRKSRVDFKDRSVRLYKSTKRPIKMQLRHL